MNLSVIYEDNHLLVVEKIPNILSQSDNTNDIDMVTLCKKYIKEKYDKPGNVFMGLIHRLDRPVGGAMVFAKTSKAASRLSDQVRTRKIKKIYRAVINGDCEKNGRYVDYLYKDKKSNKVRVVDKNKNDAKEAVLSYEKISTVRDIKSYNKLSLVEIDLHTGRPHQIRVQFSSRNYPLFGDQRYSKISKVGQQIALWSVSLEIIHPTTKEKMIFESNTPNEYPWNLFD